jgi:hypothetical protein
MKYKDNVIYCILRRLCKAFRFFAGQNVIFYMEFNMRVKKPQ